MHGIIEFWNWRQVRENYNEAPSSRAGRRHWIRKHGFPAPTYITPNAPVWHPEEVNEWFANRPRRYADAVAEARGEG